MRLAFVSPENWLLQLASGLSCRGHDVSVNAPREDEDFILGMSISVMGQVEEAVARCPKAKLVLLHWDCYSWHWSRPRKGEYDWRRWGSLLWRAKEVWCPSEIERVRLRRWYGEQLPAAVVPTFVPNLERFGEGPYPDGRFVLDVLRPLPDPRVDWVAHAAAALGVPVKGRHELSEEDYVAAVRGCTVAVSAFDEASTGGLGLVEAAWCGKPVIVNGMGGNAGVEYLDGRADTFANTFTTYDGLRDLLHRAFYGPERLAPPRPRRELARRYDVETMVTRVEERLRAHP